MNSRKRRYVKRKQSLRKRSPRKRSPRKRSPRKQSAGGIYVDNYTAHLENYIIPECDKLRVYKKNEQRPLVNTSDDCEGPASYYKGIKICQPRGLFKNCGYTTDGVNIKDATDKMHLYCSNYMRDQRSNWSEDAQEEECKKWTNYYHNFIKN